MNSASPKDPRTTNSYNTWKFGWTPGKIFARLLFVVRWIKHYAMGRMHKHSPHSHFSSIWKMLFNMKINNSHIDSLNVDTNWNNWLQYFAVLTAKPAEKAGASQGHMNQGIAVLPWHPAILQQISIVTNRLLQLINLYQNSSTKQSPCFQHQLSDFIKLLCHTIKPNFRVVYY